MDRIVNRRLLFVTQRTACALLFVRQIVSCALILLSVSGCSLFEQANSFSSLLQADAASSELARSKSRQSQVADAPTSVDQISQIEQEFAKTFDQPSAPDGRLLSPEFGDSEGPAVRRSLAQSTSTDTDSPYPTIARPVSRARDLFDDAAKQGTPGSDPRSVKSMEQTINIMAANQSQEQTDQDSQPIVAQVNAESSGTTIPPNAGGSRQQQEASGFERLRGFLPERKPGNLLKRQFENISAPWEWNPFGGREDNPSAPKQTPEATAEVNPPEPQATPLIASNNSDDLLEALITATEQQLDSWPQTDSGTPLQPTEFRRRQLNVRLLRLIADEPAAAAEAMDLMTPEEQEFWQELILGISQFRNPNQNVEYDEHIAATIGQLRQAVQQLEPLSSLSIGRLDFCSKIHKFGMIDTFPSNTFGPGDRLLIYAEVDNLQPEVSPLDTYHTSFSGTLEIWSDSSEEPIESWPHASITDDSTTRRSDFYQNYQITLPAHLPQGDYEIRLQVRDDISGRSIDSTLKFAVQ
jgi:hypothetical protein